MTSPVRAALLPALALSLLAACGGGGGGYSPPASPPTSPPTSPPSSPPASPPANAPPTFSSAGAVSVQENMIGVVYRPVATDPEGATLTYGASIGGPDAARFVMNATTREVRFAAQPDFEAPADQGANNVYDISFTVSDGANTVTQTVAITVTNVGNTFRVRRLANGIGQPIYVAGLPDGSGRLVVVDRSGRIRVMDANTGALAATDFLNISTQVNSTEGEKGLLAIAFSPNFIVDRTFYIHMNPTASNTTEIRQYKVLTTDFAQADPASGNVILSVPQPSGSGFTNHKGGFLAFDAGGRLLIGLGDGGSGGDPLGNGQNNTQLLGKVLRIDPTQDAFPADDARDYAIPSANPFATTGGAAEIWLTGLRNPFRGGVDPVTGDIFIGDVGQGLVEEVDRIPANATGLLNYGWGRREGSQPYNGGANDPSFILPVAEYFHGSGATQGNSITGGVVYRGPIETLQGQYLFADFVTPNLWSIPIASLNIGSVFPAASFTLRSTDFAPDAGAINSVVNFGTDSAGNVYIIDLGGEVFKIEPGP